MLSIVLLYNSFFSILVICLFLGRILVYMSLCHLDLFIHFNLVLSVSVSIYVHYVVFCSFALHPLMFLPCQACCISQRLIIFLIFLSFGSNTHYDEVPFIRLALIEPLAYKFMLFS